MSLLIGGFLLFAVSFAMRRLGRPKPTEITIRVVIQQGDPPGRREPPPLRPDPLIDAGLDATGRLWEIRDEHRVSTRRDAAQRNAPLRGLGEPGHPAPFHLTRTNEEQSYPAWTSAGGGPR
jgi:hypothetical protein